MKGLILAGGSGKRLRPLTHTGPKQLIPVANKPVLFYCIEDLKNAGIEEAAIIVAGDDHARVEAIKNAVGDGSKWGLNVSYIEQDTPRGLAHAVAITKDFVGGDDFVVYLGDNMLKGGIKGFVEEFENSNADASILLSEHKYPEKFGVALLNKEGEIIDVEEKPENPKSNLVIIGVYIFTSKIFEVIKEIKPSARGELEITHAIQKHVESKDCKVISHVVEGWWDDTGNAEDILHANHLVLMEIESENRGAVEEDVKIVGNVKIGEGSVIKKGSVIKGPVIIGKNTVIGPDTYIGSYTSIDDDCKIEGGDIESSIILKGTVIKFKGKIVDSLIGKESRVLSSDNRLPKGYKFIMGENSEVEI